MGQLLLKRRRLECPSIPCEHVIYHILQVSFFPNMIYFALSSRSGCMASRKNEIHHLKIHRSVIVKPGTDKFRFDDLSYGRKNVLWVAGNRFHLHQGFPPVSACSPAGKLLP